MSSFDRKSHRLVDGPFMVVGFNQMFKRLSRGAHRQAASCIVAPPVAYLRNDLQLFRHCETRKCSCQVDIRTQRNPFSVCATLSVSINVPPTLRKLWIARTRGDDMTDERGGERRHPRHKVLHVSTGKGGHGN